MKYLQQSQNVRGILVCIQQQTTRRCAQFDLCSPRSKKTEEQKIESFVWSHIGGLGATTEPGLFVQHLGACLLSWTAEGQTNWNLLPGNRQSLSLLSLLIRWLQPTTSLTSTPYCQDLTRACTAHREHNVYGQQLGLYLVIIKIWGKQMKDTIGSEKLSALQAVRRDDLESSSIAGCCGNRCCWENELRQSEFSTRFHYIFLHLGFFFLWKSLPHSQLSTLFLCCSVVLKVSSLLASCWHPSSSSFPYCF